MTRWQILGWVLAAVVGALIGVLLEHRPTVTPVPQQPRTFHPEIGWTTCNRRVVNRCSPT